MFDLPFGDIAQNLGNVLGGLRNTVFSSIQNPFSGGGLQAPNPFQGQQFQAQSPFAGQQWQVGNPFGGGFGAQNPFGQSPWHVANWSQAGADNPLNQTSGSGSGSGGASTANPQLVGMSGNAASVDAWIKSQRPNSPLAGEGSFIVSEAQKAGVPPAMILGIMMQESQLGSDGSYLPSVNNFTGLTGTGWQGQTGSTSGMARAFATFATREDGIRAAIQNYAKNYQGLTVRQAVGKWLTGDPNGTGDEQGNSANDYLTTIAHVFSAFGVPWNPDAVPTLAATTQGSGDLNQLANSGVQWAQKAQPLMGVAYTNGGIRDTGDPRSGMDCSSFVGYVKGLDRGLWNAQAQADAAQKIAPGASLAQAMGQLQPGDLIFFQGTTNDDPSARPVTHVGIYIGGGKMLHTGGSPGVQVVDLNTEYWQQHYYGAGRLG